MQKYEYTAPHHNLRFRSMNEIQDGFYFMLEPPGKAVTLWLALDKVNKHCKWVENVLRQYQ